MFDNFTFNTDVVNQMAQTLEFNEAKIVFVPCEVAEEHVNRQWVVYKNNKGEIFAQDCVILSEALRKTAENAVVDVFNLLGRYLYLMPNEMILCEEGHYPCVDRFSLLDGFRCVSKDDFCDKPYITGVALRRSTATMGNIIATHLESRRVDILPKLPLDMFYSVSVTGMFTAPVDTSVLECIIPSDSFDIGVNDFVDNSFSTFGDNAFSSFGNSNYPFSFGSEQHKKLKLGLAFISGCIGTLLSVTVWREIEKRLKL